MLLHAQGWKLAEFGFRAVTVNDIARMLYAFETYSADETSIYEWDKKLSNFLIQKGAELTPNQISEALSKLPMLSAIELPEEEWTLSLTYDELVKGRVYAWLNGWYKRDRRLGYEYSPKVKILAEKIYCDTLWGSASKSVFEELCLGRFEPYYREYKGVDVRTSVGEGASERGFRVRKKILLTLPLLSRFGCDVPSQAIEQAVRSWTTIRANFRLPGRFRPPPFWQVIDTLRLGTEFVLRHGYALVASYHNIVRAAAQANISVTSFALEHDVRKYLEPSIVELGVRVWSLRTNISLPMGYPIRGSISSPMAIAETYFFRFRNNEGLIDLLEVMCGVIQHNVGALTARRQSELFGLPASGALDCERRFLIFRNAKSGWDGLRAIEHRPVPSLVGELIGILEYMHNEMPGEERERHLFCLPGERGKLVHSISAFNSAFDALCDYFETPLNENNERNYIRQHQLRKFFVIAFFYGSSYASLDILRWFLGHSDAEYLWNYITMQIPGEMLREVQATFLVGELSESKNEGKATPEFEIEIECREKLECLVLERFGTKNFKLIDSCALESYINVLLKRNIEIQPFFYETPQGKRYKMGVAIQTEVRK